MQIFKKAAPFCVIFVIGLIVGAIGTKTLVMKRVAMFHKGPTSDHVDIFVDRIEGKLDLTPGQTEELRLIIGESVEKMALVRAEYRPRLKAVVEEGHVRIQEILSEEQWAEYDALVRKHISKILL